MKIGIITLWQSSDNYGQQLQCWALQQELIKLGHEPYLIRYDIEHKFGKNKPSIMKKILKLLLVYPIVPFLMRKIKERKEQKLGAYNALRNVERNFANFRKDNVIMSNLVYTSLQNLKEIPPRADAYIVGSDQVWAFSLDNLENRAMFLDFGEKTTRRIAYAPSFSMPSYPDRLKSLLKNNLERFDFLSVREQTGVKICNELGFQSQTVLDPTLLLEKDSYETISSSESIGDYIYLYYLNIKDAEEVQWCRLKQFAKKTKLKIIATPASGYIQGRELFDNVEYRYATIPQWINLINGARLVVTTSFHGVVFCILHHTPFVYFPLKGKFSRGNNRVLDLLKELGLEDRCISGSVDYHRLDKLIIKWNDVDILLKCNRIKSIEYLKQALK
jgi:hypothetical protein